MRQILIFERTSTLASYQLKFEELQLMNFKQGILEIKKPTLATLVCSWMTRVLTRPDKWPTHVTNLCVLEI